MSFLKKLWENFTNTEFYYKVLLTYDSIVYLPSELWEWFTKCIAYSKLLWNDRDWDYGYLLILMSFKLDRMAKCLVKNDYIENAEKYAKQIQEVRELIKQYQNNEFAEVELEAHRQKWGEMLIERYPVDNPQLTGVKFRREKAITDELHEQECKEQMIVSNLEWKRENECFKKIFKLLVKNLRNWSD